MSPHATLLAALAALVTTAATARADVIAIAATAVPLTDTDFSTTLSFARFDPALGTLQSITFDLTGTVAGLAQAENTSTRSTSRITLNLSAEIDLQRPDGTNLAAVLPLASTLFAATRFDGQLDYAGTSGTTFSNLLNTISSTDTTSAAADLALFTGSSGNAGTLLLPVVATGSSFAAGGGNIQSAFDTTASANASLIYTYLAAPTLAATSAAIDEPISVAVLGAGLALTGLLSCRKAWLYC